MPRTIDSTRTIKRRARDFRLRERDISKKKIVTDSQNKVCTNFFVIDLRLSILMELVQHYFLF